MDVLAQQLGATYVNLFLMQDDPSAVRNDIQAALDDLAYTQVSHHLGLLMMLATDKSPVISRSNRSIL